MKKRELKEKLLHLVKAVLRVILIGSCWHKYSTIQLAYHKEEKKK